MGAVFAIFAGFYYWIEKMVGLKYDELLGKIHFWTFFIGVNLTFFPMHFLGLAGMPRRISDYPDAFAGWNYIASVGSIVSTVASLFFFYLVWNMFTTRVAGLFVLDAATSWQMNFQTPATDTMEKIVDLHHDIMFFLVLIVVFVSYMLTTIIWHYASTNKTSLRVAFSHHTLLEKVWTYIPTVIILTIASPSFSLLYSLDAVVDPKITLKVIGHQWYWSYETIDMLTGREVNFDSYMLLESDLPAGGLRLLEVDNRITVPARTEIRLLITSVDVIHSWAVPALGVKMDACPGRLNQVALRINRPGTFYGQCSELCGINHSFMPIVVDVVTPEQYVRWIETVVLLPCLLNQDGNNVRSLS